MSDPEVLNFQSGDWCAGSRYAIVKLIARGGMAEVYEALDLVGKKRCAVKISQLRHQHNDALTEKMAAEARALQEFSHPNLVRVFEAGLDHGTFYFVMELLDGRTLRDTLHAEGALPLERALDWVAQVADGVHQLNEVGIVHRDLKPENILLAKADGNDDGPENRVPKVLDLGVAKFKRYGLKSTAIGDQMGTAAYMSPEHIRGDKDIDRRADVYALGHILYECVLGRHAFMDAGGEMPSLSDFTTWQLHRVPVPLAELVRGLPLAVSTLADRALQKDREQRPPSAGAFAKELRIELAKLRPRHGAAPPVTPRGVVSDRGASDEAPVAPPMLSPTPSAAVPQKRTSKGTEMMLAAPLDPTPAATAPAREPVAFESPRADAARAAPPPAVSSPSRDSLASRASLASAPPLWAAVVVALAVSLVLVTGVAVVLRLRRGPTATSSSTGLSATSAPIATAASAAAPEPATPVPEASASASASGEPFVPASPSTAIDAGAAPSPPRATAGAAAPGLHHPPSPAKPATVDRPFAGEPVF